MNKFQFSHKNFFFDKEIDEHVSFTPLYKEADIFGKNNDRAWVNQVIIGFSILFIFEVHAFIPNFKKPYRLNIW